MARPLVGNGLRAIIARGKPRYPMGSPNPTGKNGSVSKLKTSAMTGELDPIEAAKLKLQRKLTKLGIKQ
jgi:hypothetical protein